MAVTHTTDELLIIETMEHQCIILNYYTDDSAGNEINSTEDLLKFYVLLSESPGYKEIVFLRIDATNNPTAKNFIINKRAHIMTTYFKGSLLNMNYVTSKNDIVQLLQQLNEKCSC